MKRVKRTESDRVVRHHKDLAVAGDRRHANRRERIGDKDEEGRRVRNQRAVRSHAIADRSHG